MNPEAFYTALEAKNIVLNAQQKSQFECYYQTLITVNQQMNLTAITDESEVYLKHFYDSISPSFYATALQTQSLKVCDVGAGAGFPSLPLKILFPQLEITIIDSLQKRINFLKELVQLLDLKNVTLIHDRAETFGQNSHYREQFDIVTARAVASLNVLSELCLPLVKVNGQFLALKASQSQSELEAAEKAIATLGGEVASQDQFYLPKTKDPRVLLTINKIKPTPDKYPRKPGMPNKKPLIN